MQRELEVQPHGSIGRVSAWVPPGEYYLLLQFEDTPVRLVGQSLSVISVLVILAIIGWQLYRSIKARG